MRSCRSTCRLRAARRGRRKVHPGAPSTRPDRAPSTAIVCIRVSPVPPDFEMATKRVEASGRRWRTWSKVTGSRLSRKWTRGASAKRPAPGTA